MRLERKALAAELFEVDKIERTHVPVRRIDKRAKVTLLDHRTVVGLMYVDGKRRKVLNLRLNSEVVQRCERREERSEVACGAKSGQDAERSGMPAA